jgi:hypothetical protein
MSSTHQEKTSAFLRLIVRNPIMESGECMSLASIDGEQSVLIEVDNTLLLDANKPTTLENLNDPISFWHLRKNAENL